MPLPRSSTSLRSSRDFTTFTRTPARDRISTKPPAQPYVSPNTMLTFGLRVASDTSSLVKMLYTLGLLAMIASSLAKGLPPTAEGAAVAKTSGRGLVEMMWVPWTIYGKGTWSGHYVPRPEPEVTKPEPETETLEAEALKATNLAEPGALCARLHGADCTHLRA